MPILSGNLLTILLVSQRGKGKLAKKLAKLSFALDDLYYDNRHKHIHIVQ